LHFDNLPLLIVLAKLSQTLNEKRNIPQYHCSCVKWKAIVKAKVLLVLAFMLPIVLANMSLDFSCMIVGNFHGLTLRTFVDTAAIEYLLSHRRILWSKPPCCFSYSTANFASIHLFSQLSAIDILLSYIFVCWTYFQLLW